MDNTFIISSVGNTGSSLYGLPYTKENYIKLTDKIVEIIKEIIDNNIKDYKKFNFLYGGGVGSDHVFYMAITKLKENLPEEYKELQFTTSILYPCQNYRKRATANVKKIITEMAENADDIDYLYHRPFKSSSDVVEADKEICNRANTIIAILNTFNTYAGGYRAVHLSKSKGIKIYIINPNEFKDSSNSKKGGRKYGFEALNKYWQTDTGEL